MFEIHAYSNLDDNWQQRDKEMDAAVGLSAHKGEASGPTKGKKYGRRHRIWLAETFAEAMAYKQLLEQIEGVNVTVREQ